MDPTNNQFEIILPSARFPFRLADLLRCNYGPYTLQNVFRTITKEQQRACVELWIRNQALSSEIAAWIRSEEVCYFITETATGNLVGMNTLYIDHLSAPDGRYLFYRMFIDPLFRNSRLMIVGTAMAACYAKIHLAKYGVLGVVNVNENPKLARRGLATVFSRLGYQVIDQQDGHDSWLFLF
jgi:hypothetical protein